MSVETAPESENQPTLRREALLPSERNRRMGSVAVVCSMAGVASGLALATTVMAMQVADSMSLRACPFRVMTSELRPVTEPEHGFLGIRYVFRDGVAEIESVLPDTPAEVIQLRRGDHVVSIDGEPLRSSSDLQERIFSAVPGAQPSLVVERNGETLHVRPTLAAWPETSY